MKKEYAILYNDAGQHIDTISIKKTEDVFYYKKRKAYNIKRTDHNYFKFTNWIFFIKIEKFYYSYHLNNPDPINFIKNDITKFTPDMYNIMLRTSVLENLNKIKGNFFANLNFKTILIILGGLALVAYFLSGGKLW